MSTIAIIGTGIAGMGCGHFLHKKFDLTFYEQNDYVGGHTNTVTADEEGTPVFIDTGFMVYNEATYPNLTRLFKELKVPTKPTSMSFSVQHVPSGLEFCGSGFNGLFAQRKNILNVRFISLLQHIARFNKESVEVLGDERYLSYTLAQYINEKKYGSDFLEKYLIPMSSAVWSTPPDLMLEFPAVTLVRFFKNHGFLGLNTQHQWRTVVNGSATYKDILVAPFKEKILTNKKAIRVERKGASVLVSVSDGSHVAFDRVIFACHADQALHILNDPTEMERRLLGPFHYQNNIATLHTDPCVMPKTKRAWSSWNYRIGRDTSGTLTPSTIYYMNSLQQVSNKKNYFVSINDAGNIHPSKVLKEIKYEHPLFSTEAIKAQSGLNALNNNSSVNFCGSYFKYGFHEDALTSALHLSREITGEKIWQ